MGLISTDFAALSRHWNTAARIVEGAGRMRGEAVAMLDRIAPRMRHEDRELYPLARRD